MPALCLATGLFCEENQFSKNRTSRFSAYTNIFILVILWHKKYENFLQKEFSKVCIKRKRKEKSADFYCNCLVIVRQIYFKVSKEVGTLYGDNRKEGILCGQVMVPERTHSNTIKIMLPFLNVQWRNYVKQWFHGLKMQ